MGGCPCRGALVVEWLERAVAVREISGSIPGRGRHKKTFAEVGYLLTTLFSVWLSKDSRSIHSIHTIQSQEQHNNAPYKRLTRWKWISVRSHQMSLAHFLPNDL